MVPGVAVGGGVAVGVGVGVGDGEDGLDKAWYAKTPPIMMMITMIAAIITYVLFIFFTFRRQLFSVLLYEGARHKHYRLYIIRYNLHNSHSSCLKIESCEIATLQLQ